MGDSKVEVTIRHRAVGIQPPLYVAGSFSNPEWVPLPMEYTSGDDGVYTFTKTFQVEPLAKHQYKFRVGEGDWWILDEEAPTVTDESGNRNNVLEAPEVIDSPEAPTETTQAPDALPSDEVNVSESSIPEPNESSTEEQAEPTSESIHENADAGFEQLQSETENKALPVHADIERERADTPDFVKTSIEVADSAAILDRPTPEPDHPSEAVGEGEGEPPHPSGASTAETAAEVADTAAMLDENEQDAQPEAEPLSVEHEQDVSITAAEVADTAQALDRAESASDPEAESASTAPTEDTADVAAEVADTAALLDANEPAEHIEEVPLASGSLAGVKFDMKDDGLDIAGHTEGPDPVPLFAHECAGLYEDDEVPAVSHVEADIQANDFAPEHDSQQDFNDPTLEQFPSTKDEIISTVRRVSTSLNADQTSVEGISPSPVVEAQSEAAGDAVSDLDEQGVGLASDRGQDDSIPLARSHSQKSLSEHPLSLHSIAEGAEEEEAERPADEGVSSALESDETNHVAAAGTTEPSTEVLEESAASQVAPVAEQAQTADEVIEAAQEAEGEQAADVSLVDDESPAVVQEDGPIVEDATPETDENPPASEPVTATTEEASVAEEGPASNEDVVKEAPVTSGDVAPVEGSSTIGEAPLSIEDVVERDTAVDKALPDEEVPATQEPSAEAEASSSIEEAAPVPEAEPFAATETAAVTEETPATREVSTAVEEAPAPSVQEDSIVEEEAPAVKESPDVEDAPVLEEAAPIEEVTAGKEEALVVEDAPDVDEAVPIEEARAVEDSPTLEDEEAPVAEEAPVSEEAAPIEEISVVEQVAQTKDDAPAAEAASVGSAPEDVQDGSITEAAPTVQSTGPSNEEILPATEESLSAEETSPAIDELSRAPQEASSIGEEASPPEEASALSTVEDFSVVVDEAPLATEETTPAAEHADSTDNPADSLREADSEGLQEAEADQITPAAEAAETAGEAAPLAEEGEDALIPPKPHLQSLVTVPSPSVKPSNGHLSPVSDEDEAVVLKSSKGEDKSTESTQPEYLAPEPVKTPGHEEPGSPMEPPPNDADPVADFALEDEVSKADLEPTLAASRSPQIVVSNAEVTEHEELVPALSLGESASKEIKGPEDVEPAKDIDAPQGVGEASETIESSKNAASPEASPDQQTSDAAAEASSPEEVVKSREIQEGPRVEAVAESSGAEPSQSGSLTKRTVARPSSADRAGTPNPITDSHREAAKGGNWFSAFFRLIFIDLFGGLMSRLCGGKRKTIVTTVVALTAVGLVFYQKSKDPGTEVD